LNFDLPEDYFMKLRDRFKDAVSSAFNREVRANTSHAQKWEIGGFAHPHSDNSDMEGNSNAFEINKYVGILYLNDNYGDGELYFPEHDIDIKAESKEFVIFPGGIKNIHGVKPISSGTRYTMVSFWDYAEAEYSEETKEKWESEIKEVRKFQEKQREDWKNGVVG
jgi:hypothetical protein